jgi:phage/plasmid primase-like uncharacterized protein
MINPNFEKDLFVTYHSAPTIEKQDLKDECKKHMQEFGLEPPIPIITDGKIHRYSVGNKKGQLNEWYIAFEGFTERGNFYLICTYGSWSKNIKYEFKSFDNNNQFDEEERKRLHESLKKRQKEVEKQLKDERERSAKEADKIWIESHEHPPSEKYLTYPKAKSIDPLSVKFGLNPNGYPSIIIPIKNINGQTRSLQFISMGTDGRSYKTFLSGGEKKGNFFILGEIQEEDHIHVSEGYATGVSVYKSKKSPTIIAFDSGNIEPVLENIRKKYPNNKITIAADSDEIGKEKAFSAAKKYKCNVVFPVFPAENNMDQNGGKYTDFNDLQKICGEHEVLKQLNTTDESTEQEKNKPLPKIEIKPGEIHVLTSLAEQLLCESYSGIYQRGGQLVRIVTEKTKPNKSKKNSKNGIHTIKRSNDALLIAEADPIHLSEILGKLALWEKFDLRSGNYQQKDCPERVAKTLIARREWDLPVLVGIIQAPTLRYDGSILETPGYDEETGLFFNPGQTIFFPIPQSPSKDDAILARNKLLKLVSGFPFENEESKAVAISAILTGLVRKSLRTAPLHGFTAPKMGTGKSLLADTAGLIATGKTNCAIPQAENEAEEKKRLLAVLAEGDPIICYDNIERPFGSPALCSVLSQEEYKDRLLGSTRNLNVPTQATFLVTGNNLTFVGDISTRAILCRLDPQCERPEERSFDVDLYRYIPQHRSELVQAALTILRAYHVAGRPKQSFEQFGRFETWSDFVRSAIVWVDLADPCASRKEIENTDPVRIALGSLLSSWYEAFGDMSRRVKDVVKEAENKKLEHLLEALAEIAPDIKGCGINTRSLGKKLGTFNRRIENGYRLEKTGTYQSVDTWRVVKVK